ncbi:TPA: hypothetical protein ACOF2E_002908, partial [Staphylococcus aureus]
KCYLWVLYKREGQRYYLHIRTWNGSVPTSQLLSDLCGEIS